MAVTICITSSSFDVIIVTEWTDHLIISDKVDFTIGTVNVKVQIDNLYWVFAVSLDAVDACFAGTEFLCIGQCGVLANSGID